MTAVSLNIGSSFCLIKPANWDIAHPKCNKKSNNMVPVIVSYAGTVT